MSEKLHQVKALLSNIRADGESYHALLHALEAQRMCMIRRDGDALLAVNERIMALYRHIDDGTRERRRLLRLLGVSADRAGVMRVLRWLPAAQNRAAQALWQTLARRAERCRTYNEKNGELLTRQYAFIRTFLGNEPDFIYRP